MGTSKNAPFGPWANLSPHKCVLKTPQYTKYSGVSKTFSGPKTFAQIHKKEFLEAA